MYNIPHNYSVFLKNMALMSIVQNSGASHYLMINCSVRMCVCGLARGPRGRVCTSTGCEFWMVGSAPILPKPTYIHVNISDINAQTIQCSGLLK